MIYEDLLRVSIASVLNYKTQPLKQHLSQKGMDNFIIFFLLYFYRIQIYFTDYFIQVVVTGE